MSLLVSVGSGSSGSTLAARLAANETFKILILEAGPYVGNVIDIPSIGPLLQRSTVDWNYETVPQKNGCWALNDNVSYWPMGRLYGGTSRFNNMIYSRGHPEDYKTWFGDEDNYSYERDILPYFLKSENQLGRYKNSPSHSINGPLTVNDLSFRTEFSSDFLDAASILGYKISDLNNGKNNGFMEVQANLKNGRRHTPAHHLQSLKLKNLDIKTNSFVEKVLFLDNYEAYGVEYDFFGVKKFVKAERGVILCAGVIGTPKILMLSGIGPKSHLEKIDITVKIDLPVGENLQDHVTTGLDLVTLNTTAGLDFFHLISPFSAFDYFFKEKGSWTTIGCDVIGIMNNELEFMLLPIGITSDFGAHLRHAINLKDTVWAGYFEKLRRVDTVSVIPVLLHPRSKGYVRLRDKNPKSKPLINPRYLSDSYDVKILIKGIELLKDIVKKLSKFEGNLTEKTFPGCEEFQFDSRDYWECYVRHLTLSSYHPVGTCAIGTVLDYDFKVKKTNKLYVVDASSIPHLTSGNINAAIVMMAEKAADAIKKKEEIGKCHIVDLFTYLL